MSILSKFKSKFENIGKKRDKEEVPEVNKPTKAKSDETTLRQASSSAKASADRQGEKETKAEVKDKSGKASQVILRPLQTEKITDQMIWGQYTFEVAIDTNKSEIKKAIKAIYNVEPVRVHVVNVRGKAVRFGRTWSKRKNWKKAIVTLRSGDKIEVYEGV